jgi:hypothetical protein
MQNNISEEEIGGKEKTVEEKTDGIPAMEHCKGRGRTQVGITVYKGL